MFRITLLLAAALAFYAGTAHAARVSSDREDYAACVRASAQAFRVPELSIWLILDVERGTVGRVSQNKNGTYDIGPMQVNSIWLKKIAPYGISEPQLRDNLCMNIYVGTWIFAQELQRHGTLPKAFAYYHSPTARFQQRYLGLIQNALARRQARMQQDIAAAN